MTIHGHPTHDKKQEKIEQLQLAWEKEIPGSSKRALLLMAIVDEIKDLEQRPGEALKQLQWVWERSSERDFKEEVWALSAEKIKEIRSE